MQHRGYPTLAPAAFTLMVFFWPALAHVPQSPHVTYFAFPLAGRVHPSRGEASVTPPYISKAQVLDYLYVPQLTQTTTRTRWSILCERQQPPGWPLERPSASNSNPRLYSKRPNTFNRPPHIATSIPPPVPCSEPPSPPSNSGRTHRSWALSVSCTKARAPWRRHLFQPPPTRPHVYTPAKRCT